MGLSRSSKMSVFLALFKYFYSSCGEKATMPLTVKSPAHLSMTERDSLSTTERIWVSVAPHSSSKDIWTPEASALGHCTARVPLNS